MWIPGLRHAVGCGLLAASILCCTPPACRAGAAEQPVDFSALLREADNARTSDHSRFLEIIEKLGARRDELSAGQRTYLRYLEAYRISYSGDYEAAIGPLAAIIKDSGDVTLRFRAGITLTNILALSAHYEEAYSRLNELLELQPQVPDKATQLQGFGIAALLYNQAGQYDLALSNADKWIANDMDGTAACKGGCQKVEALYRSGKLALDSPEIRQGLAGCDRIKDPVYKNIIRAFVARMLMDKGRFAEVIKLLGDSYDEVQRTKYTRLTSEVDSILAAAYLAAGDSARARSYAESAVAKAVRNEATKPLVDAYQILYGIAKRSGDLQSALAFHEKYAEIDKGYLTDTSARTLAYQMVQQQVADKKRQIDVLSERNQVLLLEQQVAEKSAETERLYVALLIGALAVIALWAWRTK
ncbi:MAG TPA: GGDEF domain-containing protein, partial [Rudaea sp.]|nr:GGDEF domain-containing protein [Rudaea sp.]